MPATDRLHSPTPEDLMAHLDGESPAEAGAAIQAHLANCTECQAVVADLRGVAREMDAWTVESVPDALRPVRLPRTKSWTLPAFSWRPAYLTLSLGTLAVTVFLGLSTLVRLPNQTRAAVPPPAAVRLPAAVGAPAASISTVNGAVDGRLDRNGAVDSVGRVAGGGGGRRPAPEPEAALVAAREPTARAGLASAQPMAAKTDAAPRQPSVIRTATLRLVANEFDRARAPVEQIVAQAGGFVDQITVNAAPGAARTLTGSLRVPAARLGEALGKLRQLGQVTEDTQGSEDVTDRLVDLETRLANARAAEQRLNEILKNRTGKLSDVLEVEQEISRVRLEIEQMAAERVNTGRRVSYATITLEIDEVRKAGLESGALSLGTRLRVAAADGLESALESVVGAVLFVLRAGPATLLWLAAGLFVWTIGRRIFRLKADATKTRIS